MIDVEKLSRAIKASGYTQTEFANELSIGRATLSRYLRKETIVKRSLYDPICNLLGIDLVHLIQENNQEGNDMTSRRDILRYGSMVAASAFLPMPSWEDRIAACWALSKQGGDALAHLQRLLPIVEVSYAASFVPGIRSLAAQSHLLAATLALHNNNIASMVAHCDQAIEFAKNDENLLVAALIRKAVAHQYDHDEISMIANYRQAYQIADNQKCTPLLAGRAAAGLANALALQNDSQGVDRYLHIAQEIFPEDPEQDPAYQYADCGLFSLHFLTGLSHMRLDQPQAALGAFERAKALPIALKDRIEVLNSEAETSIALNDQERFISSIGLATSGARAIQSQKRLSSSSELILAAKKVWGDKRIQKLAV